MKVATWFGKLDLGTGDIDPAVQTIEKLTPPDILTMPEAQPDLRACALGGGLFEDDAGYDKALREVAIGLVRDELKRRSGAEAELLQTIEALDDLNEVINRLDERLYEWSRLYREDRLRGKDLAESLVGEDVMGELARVDLDLRETRRLVDRSLTTTINMMAPNLTELAGPLLAARLISRAGSLKHLSEMPASAIQVMGAEKALFKHLKGKAPSPKHGMIYRHPAIMGTQKRFRGRAARALAAKLAIAARMDKYRGELDPGLKVALDKRIDEIRGRKNK